MLSVVIPTRNRAALLGSALKSLVDQDFQGKNFEVLVIDNGSTDATREVVERFVSHIKQLHYIYDADPGLHVGRHRGLKESRGNVIVYADDDIRATSTWLSAINDCFQDPSVVLVGGNNLPDFHAPPPRWLQNLWQQKNRSFGGNAITSLSILELPEGRRKVSPYLVWGCNFSIRRSVLLDAGGFHPDALPSELIRFRGDGETHISDYISGGGLTCLFDSAASVYHAVTEERMTFEYFRRRAFNQGVSDSFSALRRAGSGRAAKAKWMARNLLMATRRFRAAMLEPSVDDSELRMLNRLTSAAYRDGVNYHRKMYQTDAEVRKWVHRADYY